MSHSESRGVPVAFPCRQGQLEKRSCPLALWGAVRLRCGDRVRLECVVPALGITIYTGYVYSHCRMPNGGAHPVPQLTSSKKHLSHTAEFLLVYPIAWLVVSALDEGMGCGGSKPEATQQEERGVGVGEPPRPQAQESPDEGESLAAKAARLRAQLGIAGDSGLMQTVAQAGAVLGIEAALAELPTLQLKIAMCLNRIGGNFAAPEAVVMHEALGMQEEPKVLSRGSDLLAEDGGIRSPLSGLFPAGLPVTSLVAALEKIGIRYKDLAPDGKCIKLARRHAKTIEPAHTQGMSEDEVLALILYTMEATPREESLYYLMNEVRDGTPDHLTP